MAEETVTDEEQSNHDEPQADEAAEVTVERRNGHGPGFILGLIFGAIAGAAAAALLAPSTGEEHYEASGGSAASGGSEQEMPDRLRTVLQQVRSRVEEASQEAHGATRETEERMRSRYEELIDKD